MKSIAALLASMVAMAGLGGCQTTDLWHADDTRYKFVSTSGGDVEYFQVKGKGDAGIIVIHGDVETQADTVNIIRGSFRDVAERLNKELGASVYAIARPGNGRTVGGTFGFQSTYTEYGLGRVIEAIEGISKIDGYKKFDIVGFSAGGATALMVALKRPDLVRKVVTYGGETDPLRSKAQRRNHPKQFSSSDFPIYPQKIMEEVPVSQTVDYRLLFGTEDEFVPFNIGKEFAAAMKAKGFKVTFKAIEGTTHYDFMPRNGDKVQAEIRAQLTN